MANKIGKAISLAGLVVSVASTSHAIPDQPLLQQGNLVYKGAFRVPKGKYGASTKNYSLSYGGESLTFNPQHNSLYILGHLDSEKMVLEMSIPQPVIGNDITTLNTASVLQGSIDLTGGIGYDKLAAGDAVVPNGGRPGSLLVLNNGTLIGNSWAYYDGMNQAVSSHFVANADWSAGAGFVGFFRLGSNLVDSSLANGGFVGGYMGAIPSEWQYDLGGSAFTGLGGVPTINRSSFGPCAWVFDPAMVGKADPVPATMLVGYPGGHRTLGNYQVGNLFYNSTSEIRGIVMPSGTRTVLFFGRHGLGADNFGAGSVFTGGTTYGPGTNKPSEAGNTATSASTSCGNTVVSGGDVCSYDPTDGTKGVHAYPYVYRAWAYDAAELAKVNNGTVNPATGKPFQPWEIVPYAVWDLPLPFAEGAGRILAATYDPATQQIYLAQESADRPAVEPFPVVQVFQVQTAPLPDTTPPTVFITSPAMSSTLGGTVSIGAIAADNVGVDKVEYYLQQAGKAASMLGSSNTAPYGFEWDTTTFADGSYTLYAKVYDQAGNQGQSFPVAVTINQIAADLTKPVVTSFAMPSLANSMTVPVTAFTATDNLAVAGYLITESSTIPSATASGWSAAAPTGYTFGSSGSRTAYAWAKDATGNVSLSSSCPVLVDTTPPRVNGFVMPSASNTLTTRISGLYVTDNIAVAGYLITESPQAPTAGDARWSSAVPTSFTFADYGTRTAYLWAKDTAGNVGGSLSATVIVDATPPTVTSLSPAAGSVVAGGVTINATATDNAAVATMQIYIDGALKNTVSGDSLNWIWDASPYVAGSHTIMVKASDSAGNYATRSISVTK